MIWLHQKRFQRYSALLEHHSEVEINGYGLK